MSVLLWFKRDLRITDHPALARAVALGRVVPVYIIEPALWAQPDASARHYAFVFDSLRDLRADLRQRGSDLVIRVGDAVAVLEELRRETSARQLVSHEETGNDWSYARDRRVADWARGQGVLWTQVAQCAVVRGAHDRDQWARHRNAYMTSDLAHVAGPLPSVGLRSDTPPTAEALGLSDPCLIAQPGGATEARRTLHSFLHERGQTYRRAMSSPLEGAEACSRLSPHLAFGTLSVRQVVQATAARQGCVKGTRDGWGGSLNSFQSRLAWRDHFIQKLEDEPALEHRCVHSAFEGLRPTDDTRLQAWQRGETGVPFVDACMRSLIATGWLNFRMRSMLMSFASYHLWLDWRETGRHLARMFTDYEPGIHWSQVQMQSGTTGINTPRIYNPVKQGRDQDPTCAFTRRWCPELARVPDALLQEPWKHAGRLSYPAPIVDVTEAGRHARETIWAVRRQAGFSEEAARVVRKHASRKDRQGHFVNDRAPKPKRAKPDSRQLSLDL